MATIYKTRVNILQNKLKELNINYFIISDADPHNSEYVCDYYKMRSAFSGFTGSNGTLVVGQSEAWLWTDGRYFVQAEKELVGSEIVLMRMGEKDVPVIKDFLVQRSEENMVVGCDGGCMMKRPADEIKETVTKAGKQIVFYYDDLIAREILKETGADWRYFNFVSKEIRVLPQHLRGKETQRNLLQIREALTKSGADVFLSAKLDTNMYLLNIRGEDVRYNPVAFSFVLITKEQTVLFVKEEAVTGELVDYAKENDIIIEAYECFYDFLPGIVKGKILMADLSSLSAKTYAILVHEEGEEKTIILDNDAGCALMQAVKSDAEIELIKDVYIKDSVAVCKFLYWLSKQKRGSVTEYEASCKMDALRYEIPGNRGLSFNTISAFGSNGAMMHYETKENECAVLEEGNLFLLDSGGQYDGGTTDVTRTVAIGTPTEEMRGHFTRVVRGMLALQNAVFMKGCTGMNLDILARRPLWEAHMDYKCGTGHGIGYMLSVHEGPQAIRMRGTGVAGATEFVPGMLVSDEPGVYLEGRYGIRMENILLCKEVCENSDGTFLCFEPLTYVPVDMRLVVREQMEPGEWKQLQDYQQLVYETIKPFLSVEECEWLASETGIS